MQGDTRIRIYDIQPAVGMPGGDVTIFCEGLKPLALDEDGLHFCGDVSMIEGASTHKLVTHIPRTPVSTDVYIVQSGEIKSNVYHFYIPPCIAHTLHTVGSPAVNSRGDIFATFSGTRGQLTPASVFRISQDGEKKPIINALMNATALVTGPDDRLYISSRYDGNIYVSDYQGNYSLFCRGLGEAFGMAFDSKGDLFVGDRTGSVFRVRPDGSSDFFADLPASPIAYHLAMDSADNLYVTVPVEIGENTIYRITPEGEITEFLTDLSEFHGIVIDGEDRIFIAEVCQGKGAVVMIDPASGEKRRILSGDEIISLAFTPDGDLCVATFSKLYLVSGDKLELD